MADTIDTIMVSLWNPKLKDARLWNYLPSSLEQLVDDLIDAKEKGYKLNGIWRLKYDSDYHLIPPR